MTERLKRVGGRQLLYVMAAEAEYGPALQALIKPLMTGVGPVEAAVQVARLLSVYDLDGRRPDLVVCLGSAGSATLEQTAVYQASSIAYRDMDASPLGFAKGATPFLDLPAVIDLPWRIPGLPTARLSTGGNIVSGAAYGSIDADMVDMETYAVLRACMQYAIPLIGLRGISDGKEDLKHVDDWTQYLHVIDTRLAAAVEALETAIVEGTLVF